MSRYLYFFILSIAYIALLYSCKTTQSANFRTAYNIQNWEERTAINRFVELYTGSFTHGQIVEDTSDSIYISSCVLGDPDKKGYYIYEEHAFSQALDRPLYALVWKLNRLAPDSFQIRSISSYVDGQNMDQNPFLGALYNEELRKNALPDTLKVVENEGFLFESMQENERGFACKDLIFKPTENTITEWFSSMGPCLVISRGKPLGLIQKTKVNIQATEIEYFYLNYRIDSTMNNGQDPDYHMIVTDTALQYSVIRKRAKTDIFATFRENLKD